jgi:hypothetical protein
MKIFIGKLKVAFSGFRNKSEGEIEMIASIYSDECLVLWDALKKKETKPELIGKLFSKYTTVNCFHYVLVDKSDGVNPSIKDEFYVLNGGYSL